MQPMLIRNVRISNAADEVYSIKDVMVDKNGQISILDAGAYLADAVLQDMVVRDAQGKFTMMPGLFDAHVHGQGGVDFADVGEYPERLPQLMAALRQSGVSYVMATLVSLQIPTLTKALRAIDAYIQEQAVNPTPGAAQIVGVHLEGPFIARNCKGAHDGNALQDSLSLPQFREIIDAAPNIKEWKMTIAPDLPGAAEFMRSVKELEKDGISVKIFIGHSNPDTAIIDRAVQAGAAGFTHLGNACMETCCREARKLETSDAQSNLVKWVLNNREACPQGVELIVDGVHLSQPFVKLVKDTIGNKIMLVTDALGPAGQSDGQYNLGTLKIRKEGNSFYLSDANGDFIMKDGTLADGSKGKVKSLAGSAAPMSHCIETYYQWMGHGEPVANRMAAIYSAAITNPRISSLSTAALQKLNDDKNFVLFNEQGQLVMSLCHGSLQQHLPELQLPPRVKESIMIYGATKAERRALTDIARTAGIEVLVPKGASIYEQERSFIYGVKGRGHQVALIVFGNEPIPFGVLSQDIINKQLPVVIYLANQEGKNQFENFKIFLSETNKILSGKGVDSFCFEKANIRIVSYDDADIELITSINCVHEKYISQPPDKRTIRQEAVRVTDEALEKTRELFSAKPGFGSESKAVSLETFKSKLNEVNRPAAAFFGTISKPTAAIDICSWSSFLANFNLIYGMGGANTGELFTEQSTMYQFAWHASRAKARVFGVIPHAQTDDEENREFSELNLKGWYITHDLAGRMQAFSESDLVIVGSCGAGTYEEVLDLLRTRANKPVWIIDVDRSTTPLINFLDSCMTMGEKCFSNLKVIHNQDDFKSAVEAFQQKGRASLRTSQNGLWASSNQSAGCGTVDCAASPRSSIQ